MSEFSELLEQLMKARNATASDLARYLNTDKSIVYKIMKGTRMPSSPQNVKDMSAFLRLPPPEAQLMLDYYKMSLVGKDKFYRRAAVAEFISGKFTHITPSISGKSMKTTFSKEDYNAMTIESEAESSRFLLHELLREAEKGEQGEIYLITNYLNKKMCDLVELVLRDYPELKVTHLISFSTLSSNHAGGSHYNLDVLKTALSLRGSSKNYKVLYVYDASAGEIITLLPFSNYVITSDSVMMLTNEGAHSIVSRNEGVRKMYGEFLLRASRDARPVFSSDDNYGSHVKRLNRQKEGDREPTYLFSRMPLFHYFISSDMLHNAMTQNELTELEDEREMHLFLHNGLTVITSGAVTLFFSLESVRDFMNTGIFPIRKRAHIAPVDLKDRVMILRRFLVNAGSIKFCLLKKQFGSTRESFTMELSSRKLAIGYSGFNGEYVNTEISEAGLCRTFMDFMLALQEDEEFSYPREEALQCIRDLIEEYEAKL